MIAQGARHIAFIEWVGGQECNPQEHYQDIKAFWRNGAWPPDF